MSGSDRPAALSEQPSRDATPDEARSAAQPPPAESRFELRGCLFGFAQRTFLLLGIYTLSIGPLYWQWYGGRFAQGSRMIAAFYEPLFRVAGAVPWFGEWMDWYVGLWI